MSSDRARVLTYALVAEPHSSGAMRPGALQAVLHLVRPRAVPWWLARDVTGEERRGRETHPHDYTRPPASLSNEVGGLSTALGLFASPLLILSTESVVVREWKLMSTAITTWVAFHGSKTSGYASPKHETGTARAHELGWS